MGNIEHRRIKSLFPSSNNLDNPSTKSQDNNHQNSTQYFNSSFNPKKQSLLQLTLSDNAEIQQILSNISRYCKQSQQSLSGGYPSISSLKEYYKVKKQGYCTQQQIFYLIFQGCSCCGLKDQFGVRKLMNKKFTDEQIISILKTYLAGIFIYIKQFKRNIQKIDLDDIGFQIFNAYNNINPSNLNQQNIPINQRQTKRKIRLFFTEPWLKQKRQQQIITVNQVNILLQNPSPERLKQNSTSHTESFLDKQTKRKNNFQKHNYSQKQFYSLLFSIGVIGLKLLQMSFVDDIYTRLPSKKVNFERIEEYLEKLLMTNKNSNRNQINGMGYDYSVGRKKLIGGLRILLLSSLPEERQKIFQFWSIKLDEINYLEEINLEYSDHFQNGREEPKNLQTDQRIPNHQVSNNQISNNVRSNVNNFSGKFYDVENSNKKEHNKFQMPTNNFMIQNNIAQNQLLNTDTHSNSLSRNEINSNRNYVYKLDQIKPSQVTNVKMVQNNVNTPTTLIKENNQFQVINKQEKQTYFQNYPANFQMLPLHKTEISRVKRETTLNQYQIRNHQQTILGEHMAGLGQNVKYLNRTSYTDNKKYQQLSHKSTQDSSIIYSAQ